MLLCGILLILLPYGVFLIVANVQPHVYTNTYYAALVDKVKRLEEHKGEKKIILVGGSNIAFGFDSESLEKEFPDYKVVNFGLYAALGTKLMLDLSKNYISAGDMVFVIPETNAEAMSLYFNPNGTLMALEERMDLISALDDENKKSITGTYFSFVNGRNQYSSPIEVSGVYQRKNFNSYGDILYTEKDENGVEYRARNRMTVHYDPTMPIDYSMSLNQDFFTYLNNYSDFVYSKGAAAYYGFSPVNSLAVKNTDSIDDFYWSIRSALKMKVIGNPHEYNIDSHYFYDSNFHLNDAGAILRTAIFAEDIKRDVFNSSSPVSIEIPEMPPYVDGGEIGDDSPTAPYFTYTDYEDSLLISGVASSHLSDTELILPSVANHKKVVGIAENAFNGSSVTSLSIPTTISILMDGCFGNSSLNSVYIETTDPSSIIVSYTGSMTTGVSEGFKIYIHDECFTDFLTDYYWGAYSSYFVRY